MSAQFFFNVSTLDFPINGFQSQAIALQIYFLIVCQEMSLIIPTAQNQKEQFHFKRISLFFS